MTKEKWQELVLGEWTVIINPCALRLKTVKQLYHLIAKALEVDQEIVGPETGPLNLPQWDSFHHVHIVVAIEEFYQVKLTFEELSSILSVSDIADILRQKGVSIQ